MKHNENLNESFSNFGHTFQEKLAYLILIDRPFSEQIEEVIELDFFELKYLKIFTSIIFEYRAKYETHPSPSTMITLLKTELEGENETARDQTVDFFERMTERGLVEDASFIKEKALDFCKKQKLKAAMLQSLKLMNASKFTEIANLIEEALGLGLDNDFGHDFMKDFEARYEENPRYPVPTGWEKMDNLTSGGFGRGELSVVIAPTGGGKSFALVHNGAAAVKEGFSVVHYTLELSEDVVGRRYDASLTNFGLDELRNVKDQVKKEIDKLEGSLVIKEYPTGAATMATLRNHLTKLVSRGRKIDLIIVDYADLMKPTRHYERRTTELGSIYKELRDLAIDFKVPVLTASQTNRTGLQKEVVTMESISEAYEKCFISDFIYSLSRTIDDKNTNQGRFFIAKNRNGPDGVVLPIRMNPGRAEIEILDEPVQTEKQVMDEFRKNNKAKLAETFNNFKKEFRKKSYTEE